MTTTALQRPVPFGRGAFAIGPELKLASDMTFEQWLEIGQRVLANYAVSRFLVGDWLHFGSWRYGKRYQAVLEVLEISYDRIRDYAYVSGRVPGPVRRPALSWWHHRLVAKLHPDEQERWLQRAEDEGWSTRELSEGLRGATQLPPAADTDEPTEPVTLEQLRLTAEPQRIERWKAAADKREMRFDEWAASVLDEASAR